MFRKTICGIMLSLLLIGIFSLTVNVKPVKSTWTGTVYIRANGSIDPPDAPIMTYDNITYELTDNITSFSDGARAIVIERDNIIIDGAGYTIQGRRNQTGIDLTGRTNVTVRNTKIINLYYGILLDHSSNNSISGNDITNNIYGIQLHSSSNNNINGNNITNNYYGVELDYFSNYTIISGNYITANNVYGIRLRSSSNNSIIGNNITNAGEGVGLYYSSNNIVSGNKLTNNVYGVWLYYSSNNIISGNYITANNEAGVRLFYSSNNSISGNNITHSYYGIYLDDYSNFNSISGNNITANNYYGVKLDYSSNFNIIVGNNIANNSYYGVLLDYSSYNNISGNTFTNNGLAVYCSHNIVMDNTVNGKPLIYLEGVADYSVGDAGQVILVNCTGIRVENLNLSRVSIGVQLWNTNNSVISGNIITNNSCGVSLYGSSNVISGNIITNNRRGISLGSSSSNIISRNNIANNGYGVELSRSSYNSINGNNITNNSYGVELWCSHGNRFYHNNFIDNGVQIDSTESIDVWDDGYPSGGNYWSDYKGIDYHSGPHQNVGGSDGIGDTPYFIDENNVDNYPLRGQFNIFDVGSWDGVKYSVDIVSNSTVSDFYFNPDEGAFIRFNVTGSDGTKGFSRVAIPKSLLWVEDGWIITVGNQPITNYTIIQDENYTYLYFAYNHSTQTIVIQGTHVIPEFPLNTALLGFLMLITISLISAAKKRFKNEHTDKTSFSMNCAHKFTLIKDFAHSLS